MVRNASELLEGEIINRIFNNRTVRNNKNCLVVTTGPTGCQPKGSKVLLSNGIWKNIEDIKSGDKVLSPQKDGTYKYSKVTGITSWFCDKMFNVVQKNRQHKKLYSCSYNHIIPVYKNFKTRGTLNGKRYVKNKWWDFSEYTAENFNKMSSKMKSHQNIGFSSFAIDKYEGKVNCNIEPYSLGVFLGDGMFYNKGYRKINITSDDYEIIKEVEKHYPVMSIGTKKNTTALSYAFNVNSLFGKLLKKYGLEGKGSGEKFIPLDAMLSNLEYRKKLLAGIIDTDGYSIKNTCSYEITLKSKRMIEDIKNLVYSIGGRCGEVREVNKSIKSINFTGKYYYVCFYLGDIVLPVKLPRKKNKSSRVYLESNRIAIDTQETDAEMVYGIQLDSESKWYVTDNWMVTHNSGKSYSNLRMAELWYKKRFEEPFPMENVCFGVLELLKRITHLSKTKRKGELIILEEAGTSMGALDFASKTSKIFSYVLQSFRSLNFILLMNLPYFTMLNKQARELVHIQLETLKIDPNEKKLYLKPFILQTNPTTGKLYRHFPRVVIDHSMECINFISYSLPGDKLQGDYEDAKQDFVLGTIGEGIEAIETIMAKKGPAERPLPRLQQAIWDLWQEGILKQKDIAAKLGIDSSGVSKSIAWMLKKGITRPKVPYSPSTPQI